MIQKFKELSNLCKITISVFMGVITLLGVGGTFAAIEDRMESKFARKQEMQWADNQCLQKAIENEKSIKVVSNALQIQALQRRIWSLQNHYLNSGQPIPAHIQQEIDYLNRQIQQLQRG